MGLRHCRSRRVLLQFRAALFDALARSSARNLAGFSPQGLSNTAWAFAKVGATNDVLMDAMTTRRVGDELRRFR